MIKNKSPFTIVEQGNHRYIYNRGNLIYKSWKGKQPSRIFNSNGWPSVEIV